MKALASRCRRLFAALVLGTLASCASVPPAPAPAERDWFIFLETGKPTPDDKPRVAEMQRGHIDNFRRLFGEKKLFAAGPLRDPSKLKRGIVVVRAADRAGLATLFQPDEYVREGYMTLNATPCTPMKPLATEGIDPNGIEEVRIVLVPRGSGNDVAGAKVLQSLVDNGTLGGWYRLDSGPWSDIAFSRLTDNAKLSAALAAHPAGVDAEKGIQLWAQWIGKGMVK